MKVTVLGAGAWGTALAQLLSQGGHAVTLWAHRPEHLEEIARTGRNEPYLPGIPLDARWQFVSDIEKAVSAPDCIVVAVPSKAFREVTGALTATRAIVISVTKGIEYGTGLTMCGVLQQTAPAARRAALSGPTFAREVIKGIPTAIVAASEDPQTAEAVQTLFHRPTFRVYTSADLLGVELGGALKNIIAIAAGVGDGLGFGDNSKAALITRAIAEIRRLGMACGAQAETFSGLSGLGDLTVTCFSRQSRNRLFGERLGSGEQIEQILMRPGATAEGYPTARSAFELSQKLRVSTPIIDEAYAMLYQNKNVARAVQDLTNRESKPED